MPFAAREAESLAHGAFTAADALDLLDWKRRILALYARVRAEPDAEAAWDRWREVREELYRTHRQSPLPPESAPRLRRCVLPVRPDVPCRRRARSTRRPSRARSLRAPAARSRSAASGCSGSCCDGSDHELELHWNEAYGGGVLLAVADETTGAETYAGGRYVLDTVKGADLGGAERSIVVDFNFAYNPSCAFDARWSCPLAPAANRLSRPARSRRACP